MPAVVPPALANGDTKPKARAAAYGSRHRMGSREPTTYDPSVLSPFPSVLALPAPAAGHEPSTVKDGRPSVILPSAKANGGDRATPGRRRAPQAKTPPLPVMTKPLSAGRSAGAESASPPRSPRQVARPRAPGATRAVKGQTQSSGQPSSSRHSLPVKKRRRPDSKSPTARSAGRTVLAVREPERVTPPAAVQPPKGQRASSRQRFRPLEFWRGERVVYGRSEDRATFEQIVDVIVAEDARELPSGGVYGSVRECCSVRRAPCPRVRIAKEQ